MQGSLDVLQSALASALGERARHPVVDRGQLTIEVEAADLVAAATVLRDARVARVLAR